MLNFGGVKNDAESFEVLKVHSWLFEKYPPIGTSPYPTLGISENHQLKSIGWEGISQEGIEIPAVLCPKAGKSKKKNKASWFSFSFKFYGFLFKYVPPQHHVHPFGWNSGAALPHGEELNLWICLSEFDPETSSH